MADHTKNVSNTVRIFGGGGASLWNAYNWNAFNWGEGTLEFVQSVQKVVQNSAVSTSTVAKEVLHYLDAQTVSLTDQYVKSPTILVSNSQSIAIDPTDETLQDGAGYTYIFTSNASNNEDRDPTTWTSASVSATSWSTVTVGSTTWS